MPAAPHTSVEVFYSYAHEDEGLRDELKKHLSNLKRQGVITDWYDRDISAGKQWNEEIETHLNSAKVILLLISPDFMNSDYISDVEVKRAMERHEAGEARVIPVILRRVDWDGAPFSKLQALPTDAMPVNSWDDPDDAFFIITKGIRKAVQELAGEYASVPTVPDIPRPPRVGFVSRRDRDGKEIVGRLRGELAPQRNQLVALWGAGGVGKTTLAAEAVRSLATTYGQRIVWITADGRPNFAFSTLLDDIAEQFGRADMRPLSTEAKESALRSLIAEKSTLIVLDNLETISPEEELRCKEFLAKRILCPALITTRERIDDALLIPIAAMSSEEAHDLLARLIQQSPDPDVYELVDRDHILKAAEYNPLIVQWVVAQIDLAQNPEEVLTDLAHGEGDAAERVFDRSYKLPQLDDGGRALLLALSLFTPSAARPALAAVAGMDLAKTRDKKRFKRAQETLASLWLLERVSGGLRLTVRGLTRELTRNRLSRDLRSKTFNQRYVARFSRFAASHNSQVPHEHDVLEVEKDNLLNAVAMAAEMHDPVTTLKLMTSIAFPGMLDMRGYWDDAIKYGKLALQAARDLGDTSLGGALTHGIGTILESKGDYSAAKEYYREAEEAARLMKNMDGLAATLYQTASLNLELGDLPAANRLSTEALELAKTNQDEDGVAKALLILARIACEQDDLQKASSLIDQSKEIARRLADDGITAGVYYQLAHIASIQRDFQRAEELYKRSLELSQKRGDKDYIAINLHALGVLATERDDHNEAKRYFTESLEISSQLGKRPGVAHCLTGLGVLHAKTGSPDAAERFFLEALTIFQEIDSSLADDIRRRLEALRRLKK